MRVGDVSGLYPRTQAVVIRSQNFGQVRAFPSPLFATCLQRVCCFLRTSKVTSWSVFSQQHPVFAGMSTDA